MVDKKTSAEDAAGALDGTELVRLTQAGASKRTTTGAIAGLGSGGGFSGAEVAITAATTLTGTAFGKMHVCSGTSGDYTVVLPPVSGNGGQSISFRMAPGLTARVTIDGNASETIDTSLSRVMWANETATLYCTGAAWVKQGGRNAAVSVVMRSGDAAYPIPPGAWTAVQTINVVRDNTSGLLVPCGDAANGRFRAFRDGFYVCSGFVAIEGVTAGKEINGGVVKNGAVPADNPNAYVTISASTSGVVQASAGGTFQLAAGDYVTCSAFNFDTATRLTRTVSTVYSTLSVTEIPAW